MTWALSVGRKIKDLGWRRRARVHLGKKEILSRWLGWEGRGVYRACRFH